MIDSNLSSIYSHHITRYIDTMTPDESTPLASKSRNPSVAYPINIQQQASSMQMPIISRQPSAVRPSHSTYFPGSPFASVKGPSSISAFANSFQRAQSFRSLEPRIKASRSYFQDDEELIDPDTLAPSQLGRKISTVFHDLRKPFDSGSTFDEAAVDDASFIDHSFSNQYGAISGPYEISRTPSMVSRAPTLSFVGNPLTRVMSNETESLFLRHVESRDGKLMTMVMPRSNVSQTIFNSINVLIGIGLLALSKAMTYAGWYWGIALLIYSASITYWTANLLAKCMDTDPTLCTYADLGYKAYGAKARLFISLLFSVELLGVGVSPQPFPWSSWLPS
ncbi:unnamed protein product [Ambrosiozyma monospora]|uniref:Unnamed protein product n=1 Tax=Ambrosiozyma monospora TaxID=43982 RepID=A0ACB5T783_AMBMO|nr:unnamed protein product [Ambrosiozyma monospora]